MSMSYAYLGLLGNQNDPTNHRRSDMDEEREEEQVREIVLCFKIMSPECKAKIDREIDLLFETKIREILLADQDYCKAMGWDCGTA
jgi:hypothetical protein